MPAAQAWKRQARWGKIAADPAPKDLSYKVEASAQGQIVLSPHNNRHSRIERFGRTQWVADVHAARCLLSRVIFSCHFTPGRTGPRWQTTGRHIASFGASPGPFPARCDCGGGLERSRQPGSPATGSRPSPTTKGAIRLRVPRVSFGLYKRIRGTSSAAPKASRASPRTRPPTTSS